MSAHTLPNIRDLAVESARRRRRNERLSSIVLHVGLISFAVITLIPFYWMIATSLKTAADVQIYPPVWIPNPPHFENFITAWTVRPFDRWFLNSIFVGSAVTILQLLTCSLAAYAFARLKFPGRDMLFLMYLGTLMIPGQVTLIPTYILMRNLEWLNSYQSLILPAAFSAFGTFLLRQFFLTIPYELEEAARIDGCNRFQTYYKIILPLAGPALAALTIFTFMRMWNDFLWPLVMIDTMDMKTVTVGLRAFQGQYMTEYNLMMAAAAVSLLPVIAVFLAAQRWFVEGITLTGITGR